MKLDILSRRNPIVFSKQISPSDDESLEQGDHSVGDDGVETRREHVTELRRQVRNGTYEIPFSQLVRILASLFLKRR